VGRHITRRRFASIASQAIALALGSGPVRAAAQSRNGRLAARPRAVVTSLKSGPLGLVQGGRDGVIQMPSVMPDGPVPLLVYLHGATGNGERALRRIGPVADRAGVVVLAPDSRDGTWDAIRGSFGEDVAFLDRALELVFSRLNVDPARLAIGGFSDGASYALSLGLANGDLFPRIVAGSPGFVMSAPSHGRPRVFISHGTSDPILPIDRCSRVIVPRLKSLGYDVTYREFEGRHELPDAVANESLEWMTAR
jgi:phospholipase/carboxylesterase